MTSRLILYPIDSADWQVDTSSPSDGDVLTYVSANSRWEAAASGGGGGTDPWTTVALATDFATTNTTAAPSNVTGWTFTPAANKVYLVEFHALGNAASTSTGIRPGYKSGMSGTIKIGMYINVPNGTQGTFIRNAFGIAAQNGFATASANATPHYLHGQGMIIAGATPSGSFQMTLATERSGIAVTLAAGSIFRYREVG